MRNYTKCNLGEKIELIDIVSESKNNLHQATLNSIYFDIKTQTIDGRIITLDLQRKFNKNRIRNRTMYYACREVSSQEVKRGEYENLKNVVVSFILTEAPLLHTNDNSKVHLQNCITGEEGKFETAKNLLKRTQDIQFICDVTGLSENKIKNLQ